MSDEDLKAELERLRSENAALKKGASTSIRMKVSEKGAVSIYGMGRFPVTLYKEQWLKLLDMSDDIRAFIAANEGQLKEKGLSGRRKFRSQDATGGGRPPTRSGPQHPAADLSTVVHERQARQRRHAAPDHARWLGLHRLRCCSRLRRLRRCHARRLRQPRQLHQPRSFERIDRLQRVDSRNTLLRDGPLSISIRPRWSSSFNDGDTNFPSMW